MLENQDSKGQIDSYIKKALQEWGVPGAAVAILHDNEVILSKGYGVKEIGKDDPIDESTLFAIGSCTKAFTAAAIGMLIDDARGEMAGGRSYISISVSLSVTRTP